MKPSKEQWGQVISDLDSLYKAVYLRCDDYLVFASLNRVSRNRLSIRVYVNGYVKGAWVGEVGKPETMSEEARRFWFPSKRQRISKKDLQWHEKVFGKRQCRREKLYDPVILPLPSWNSPRSFIRHLIKHNESIEIIDRETHEKELKVLQAAQPEES